MDDDFSSLDDRSLKTFQFGLTERELAKLKRISEELELSGRDAIGACIDDWYKRRFFFASKAVDDVEDLPF